MNRSQTIALVVLLAGLGSGPIALAQDATSVQDHVRRLRAEGLDPELQAESLAALRQLASGPIQDPGTREAVLELALYRADHPDSDRPHRVIAEMIAAVALFADDGRIAEVLPVLAMIQLEVGDPYGALLAFRDFRRRKGDFVTSEQASLAASTAASASDMRSALSWSEGWMQSPMSDAARGRMLAARLKASAALGRLDLAIASIRALELHAAESLRLDADALLTAAQVYREAGRTKDARDMYSLLVNVHPQRADHAKSLLELSRLQRETSQPLNSQETVLWLRRAHPEAAEVFASKVEELAIDYPVALPKMIPPYQELIREAREMGWIEQVSDSLFNRLTGAGFPLEAVSGLFDLIEENPNSLPSLVIRRRADRYLAAAFDLLNSRGSATAVASLASRAIELEVPIPPASISIVNQARATVGLPDVYGGRIDLALKDSETLFAEGLYAQVALRLNRLLAELNPVDPTPGWYSTALMRLAEAEWRASNDKQALSSIESAMSRLRGEEERRSLLMLKADILLAQDLKTACVSYIQADEIRSSPWSRRQRRRCDEGDAS